MLRGAGIAFLALLAVAAAARIALEPIVTARTRRALNEAPDQRGRFRDVEVSVLHLSYAIHDLHIDKRVRDLGWAPWITAKRLDAGLYWSELVRGHLVGALRLDRPKLSIYPEPKKKKPPPSEAPLIVGETLQKFTPFRLDRAEVHGGEVLWVDTNTPGRPELWFHDIDGTLENFATRAALGRGEPTILALSGTLQRTGQVSIYASADPLAKGLTFAGSARIRGLELRELGDLLSKTAEVTPTRGTLDVSARFKAADGELTGGVRPIVRNADVQQARKGLGAKIKAALADAALDVLSDRVPGRNAVATTIPIQGDLRNPEAKLWPTIAAVIRNAFVAGLADSLQGLPPPREGGGAEARRPPSTAREER